MPQPLLGLIGLGAMGSRMARNLLKAGYTLHGYDIRDEAMAELERDGGIAAPDIPTLVAQCDIVMTSLVSHVYLKVAQESLLPHARAGKTFIDLSTVPVPQTRRLAKLFEARGCDYADVPVSGWITRAEAGTLIMFIGGEPHVVQRIQPILDVLGDPDRIHYGGPVGCGQIMKVCQQLKTRILDAARMEVMAFGARSGLSLEKTLEALGVAPDSEDGYAQLYRTIAKGEGDELSCLFGEWPYYIEQAKTEGFTMPMLEGLYHFVKPGPRVNTDGQGRPGPSVWRELTTAPRR